MLIKPPDTMKELKEMIAQSPITEKRFAEKLKHKVVAYRKTGSQIVNIVEGQTGLKIDKDDLYDFISEALDLEPAFSIDKMKLWSK